MASLRPQQVQNPLMSQRSQLVQDPLMSQSLQWVAGWLAEDPAVGEGVC